jgi:hypothetical protein
VIPRELGLAAVPVRRPNPAVVLWRWRYELGVVAGLTLDAVRVGPLWTVLGGLSGAVVVAATPLRRYAWCVVLQHRVRTACKHLWLHSRTGRLPMLLWTRPVPGGVRVTLWCRPGVAAEDLAAVREQLAAACWVGAAEVRTDPSRTQIVHVVLVRQEVTA